MGWAGLCWVRFSLAGVSWGMLPVTARLCNSRDLHITLCRFFYLYWISRQRMVWSFWCNYQWAMAKFFKHTLLRFSDPKIPNALCFRALKHSILKSDEKVFLQSCRTAWWGIFCVGFSSLPFLTAVWLYSSVSPGWMDSQHEEQTVATVGE